MPNINLSTYFHSVCIPGGVFAGQTWELFRDLHFVCGASEGFHHTPQTTNFKCPRRIAPGVGFWALLEFKVNLENLDGSSVSPLYQNHVLDNLEIDFALDNRPVLIREPGRRAANGIDFNKRKVWGVSTGIHDDTDLVGSVYAPKDFDFGIGPMLLKANLLLEKLE